MYQLYYRLLSRKHENELFVILLGELDINMATSILETIVDLDTDLGFLNLIDGDLWGRTQRSSHSNFNATEF